MLLEKDDKILVQGITGREASAMVRDALDYGSAIVGGVTPGKGGQEVHGVAVYDTLREAQRHHDATVSVISVPAPAVLDAALEAMDGGIHLLLIMSERVPCLDTARILSRARELGCRVIGPNSLGLIRPGVCKLGTIGGTLDNTRRSFLPGRVAVLSRSGGMTTEIASSLTTRGIGQSICIGVGGDPIIGANFTDLLPLLEEDPGTDSLILYGEPGGRAEEQLAEYLRANPSRLKIKALLSGRFVDDMPGMRFGHAAVIVHGTEGSVKGKAALLEASGVEVVNSFEELAEGLG